MAYITIPHLKRQFGQLITETPYDAQWVSAIRYCIPLRARSWDDNVRVWRFDPDHYRAVAFITEQFFGSKMMDSTGGFSDVPQETSAWKQKWDERNKSGFYSRDDSKGKQKKSGRAATNTARGILYVTDDAPGYVITAAYRVLAAKNHPDQGGDEQYMAKINAAYQQLKKQGDV